MITLEKSKEDIKLDKIGKLLELGGTMLANHCECGVPLFRYHGNVICPICDSNSKGAIESQEKIEKDNTKPEENSSFTSSQAEQNIQNERFNEPQQVTSKPTATLPSISPETYEFINNTIINKVVQLCLDLQRETEHGRIKQQIEAIESGTRALKNLR